MLGVCSFTGHRQIERAHESYVHQKVRDGIEYLYKQGVRRFCCGGAIGFDTLCAKAVIEFKSTHPDVLLTMMLPCKNQSELWNEKQKREYEHTLSMADEILYSSDTYTQGCMRERNMRLASACDVLIAYVGRQGSGAAQTVRMAHSLGKTVYNVNPKKEYV